MRYLRFPVLGLVGCLLLAGCGRSDEGEQPTTPAAVPEPAAAPAPAQGTAWEVSARLVEVDLSVFKFTPRTIVLKVGEPVQFRVTSKDTIHSFTVKDLGLDVELTPGESKLSDVFTPQQTGIFQISCRIHSVSSYGMEGVMEITATGPGG